MKDTRTLTNTPKQEMDTLRLQIAGPLKDTCDECGRLYRKAKKWQRFCNTACHDSWHANDKARKVTALEEENRRLKARIEELEEQK